VEETTTGSTLAKDHDVLRYYLVKPQPINQDRNGRVSVLERLFTKGLVQFPKDAPFMQEIEDELLSYPFGQTDDIVDSIALALNVGGTGYDTTLSFV
jgi:phage terminase large subunit-like protein